VSSTSTTASTGDSSQPAGKRVRALLDRIASTGTLKLTVFAVISAMFFGAVVIAATDLDAWKAHHYGSILTTIGRAYWAIPQGAFGSVNGWSEVVTRTTPYIFTGLSVTLAFRAGLFNIGATGQMIAGALAATFVAIKLDLPGPIEIPLALLGGIAGGALWGAIPGVLKARTGAHEVITTIMTNYIASIMMIWVLKTSVFRRPGTGEAISRDIAKSARLPRIFSFLSRSRAETRADIGFLIAVAAALCIWWLLSHSKKGFEFRAVGSNLDAARYAGMKGGTLTVTVFMIAGGLAGIAGAGVVLGTDYHATSTLAGNIGFDAIAVALLAKSEPIATIFAAILFGVLDAGATAVQSNAGVSNDLISVLRALIVLFIAASLLTKAIWRVTSRDGEAAQAFRGWAG
jgi:general nucleoside transport system permease protein